jgi:hypothetical protein
VAESKLTAIQQEVLRAFFERERGYFLTGGAALAGYHLAHRSMDDLELFTVDPEAFVRGRHVVASVAEAIGASLEGEEAQLDRTKWSVVTSAMAQPTNGPECYVDDPGHVSVTGHRLLLSLRPSSKAPTQLSLRTSPPDSARYIPSQAATKDVHLDRSTLSGEKPGLSQTSTRLRRERRRDARIARGAMYPAVPKSSIVRAKTGCPNTLEMPKSTYFQTPATLTMFVGLISRCTTPRRWISDKPSASWIATFFASETRQTGSGSPSM